MPNSFFILIPIVFFADLIAIAVGLAYSARKAGKSVFQYYDPQPALSIVGAYCATVTVITFLIFLNETVNFVNAILYSLLFNSLNLLLAMILLVFIGRATMGREADPDYDGQEDESGADT
ncbi:MAG: hypothetical protein M9928_22330 [Anaerolineae bacterium]|nr:hypothetical protein [Anaerolineae bacterium]MCO5190929.1 hypothetical protein [Anaerolineae bacterium]MCO5194903.1 hypothetical protein [Anaerolineae bacterium]MCO5199236.1 hypothetical protein [Anaerolineae bacterium]MCO5207754.1 hypothetical protein [Anaerolineae bacterium]